MPASLKYPSDCSRRPKAAPQQNPEAGGAAGHARPGKRRHDPQTISARAKSRPSRAKWPGSPSSRQEQQEEILREFSEVALDGQHRLSAGVDVTRVTLEKALGSFKASDVLGRVAPTRASVGAMQAIADMDPRHIFNLLRDEQPQTIAFVISHLPPEKAAQVLALLRPEQRDKIVERLATLAPTPVEVAEKVVDVLNAKLGVKQTRALCARPAASPPPPTSSTPMDKTLSRSLLTSIEERNPELCQAIRKKMFTFEDLLAARIRRPSSASCAKLTCAT